MPAYLIVRFPYGNRAYNRHAQVNLYPDGSMTVRLSGLRVARHELEGYVMIEPDGTISSCRVEDAYDSRPLSESTVNAALNAARACARRARRVARQIAATTKRPVRYEPGTLEYLAMLALGKIRQDGWPKGRGPLE